MLAVYRQVSCKVLQPVLLRTHSDDPVLGVNPPRGQETDGLDRVAVSLVWMEAPHREEAKRFALASRFGDKRELR